MKNYFYSNLSALNNDLNYAVDAADSLTGYAQTSALTAYATTESLTAYAQLSDVTGGVSLSACLSSSEFDTIDPLSGEITTYALSDYIDKLNTVIYTLRRISAPEPPIPPTPTEREMTRFFYRNGTSADVDLVGVVSDRAYKNNYLITRIEFGTHCTGTGFESFWSNSYLSAIQFSSTMTEIGHDSFNGCTALKELVVPGNVLTVGQGSFRGDTALESAVFEEGVKQTNNSVFYGDSALTSLTLPSTLLNISGEFAYNCQNLVNLIIPENSQLTSIGGYAFCRCYSCNSLTIPASITSIGDNAFGDNFGLYPRSNLTFAGKTMAQVQAMSYYPWGTRSGMQLICTDGTITR